MEKMEQPTEYDKINDAIVRFVWPPLSKDVEQEIGRCFDQAIAKQVKVIYDEALNCPVDWQTASMDSALVLLADYLHTNIPWLSPEAKKRLNYCFIMEWK